jgi:hypothetical protein
VDGDHLMSNTASPNAPSLWSPSGLPACASQRMVRPSLPLESSSEVSWAHQDALSTP